MSTHYLTLINNTKYTDTHALQAHYMHCVDQLPQQAEQCTITSLDSRDFTNAADGLFRILVPIYTCYVLQIQLHQYCSSKPSLISGFIRCYLLTLLPTILQDDYNIMQIDQVQFALTSCASSNLLRDPRPNCFRLAAFPIKPKHTDYHNFINLAARCRFISDLRKALYEIAVNVKAEKTYIVFGGDAPLDTLWNGHLRHKRSYIAVL